MNSKRKLSVTGLANIASLLTKADLEPQPVRVPGKPRATQTTIAQKTIDALPIRAQGDDPSIGRIVVAAVREAYNLGHADAMVQSETVDALLKQQYDARTKLTMPAVVAAVMEHLGTSELVMHLPTVATVFDRNRIEYAVDDSGEWINYTMRPVGEVEA